ncbi:hypothetical protein A8950_3028 [Dongia mobilis]|uniref:DUF6644 domain-containing protein n=1 Tax=Dongia mobilis TaxID=578943 RepID=A0A4R6WPQ6_9PROT|nr:DUF6644 family protein [Dongia mobilis]TDQ80497.1 hypothetical protein A8950_3028 [Dongia mobilis]
MIGEITSVLEALRGWPGAVWLRGSGTAYLFVNAAHILGIALALGAILPLDLRLLGLARRAPLDLLAPFLIRCAATGLVLAIPTGLWLFSVKPADYLVNAAFLWKLGLLALAFLNIALQHRNPAFAAAGHRITRTCRTRLHAAMSMLLWLGVLLAGRWVGFL